MASYDSTRDAVGRGTDTAKAAASTNYNQYKQGTSLLSGSAADSGNTTNAQGISQGLAGMDTHAMDAVPRAGNQTVQGGSYGAYDTEGTAGTHGAPTITGTTGNLRAYEAMDVGGGGQGQGFTNYTQGTGYEAREPDSVAPGATANSAFDSSLYGGSSQGGIGATDNSSYTTHAAMGTAHNDNTPLSGAGAGMTAQRVTVVERAQGVMSDLKNTVASSATTARDRLTEAAGTNTGSATGYSGSGATGYAQPRTVGEGVSNAAQYTSNAAGQAVGATRETAGNAAAYASDVASRATDAARGAAYRAADATARTARATPDAAATATNNAAHVAGQIGGAATTAAGIVAEKAVAAKDAVVGKAQEWNAPNEPGGPTLVERVQGNVADTAGNVAGQAAAAKDAVAAKAQDINAPSTPGGPTLTEQAQDTAVVAKDTLVSGAAVAGQKIVETAVAAKEALTPHAIAARDALAPHAAAARDQVVTQAAVTRDVLADRAVAAKEAIAANAATAAEDARNFRPAEAAEGLAAGQRVKVPLLGHVSREQVYGAAGVLSLAWLAALGAGVSTVLLVPLAAMMFLVASAAAFVALLRRGVPVNNPAALAQTARTTAADAAERARIAALNAKDSLPATFNSAASSAQTYAASARDYAANTAGQAVGFVQQTVGVGAGGRALPAGVTVGPNNKLLDHTGKPLRYNISVAEDGRTLLAADGSPLPKGFKLAAGGVLLGPNNRPMPHGVRFGPGATLLSARGIPLPNGMSFGPASTLVDAEGTLLTPDLEPVPEGFHLSSDDGRLLRPSGKPIPMGVHVGPASKLLTPDGDELPEGIKIGPNGSIVTPDGTLLGPDGRVVPDGYRLSPDRTQLLAPNGTVVPPHLNLGPAGTLIGDHGMLLDVDGDVLPDEFKLGALGHLLHNGIPVPHGARVDAHGTLHMGRASSMRQGAY